MRASAKAPLWVVFAKVVDVPSVRKVVSLAVLKIVCPGSGCLSGQVWAEPFWLKLARHFGVLLFAKDQVS